MYFLPITLYYGENLLCSTVWFVLIIEVYLFHLVLLLSREEKCDLSGRARAQKGANGQEVTRLGMEYDMFFDCQNPSENVQKLNDTLGNMFDECFPLISIKMSSRDPPLLI